MVYYIRYIVSHIILNKKEKNEMTLQLENLKPQEVFKYFSDISQIPRGTGNEKQIRDYLTREGKKIRLEDDQDESIKVLIKKPSTK